MKLYKPKQFRCIKTNSDQQRPGFNSISIQFNFIHTTPHHTDVISGYFHLEQVLTRLFVVIIHRDPTFPPWTSTWQQWQQKNSLLTGRNIERIPAHGGRPSASTGWNYSLIFWMNTSMASAWRKTRLKLIKKEILLTLLLFMKLPVWFI